MSKFFIEHPILANVIAIITILLGAVCLLRLPVAEYPEIVPPTFILIPRMMRIGFLIRLVAVMRVNKDLITHCRSQLVRRLIQIKMVTGINGSQPLPFRNALR